VQTVPDIAKDPKAFVARYKELLEDDSVKFPVHYLAQELGLDSWIVRRRLGRHGVTEKTCPDQRVYEREHLVGELLFLRAAGMTYPVIAEKLGFDLEGFFSTSSYWYLHDHITFNPRDEYEAPMKIDSAVTR